LYKDFIYAGGMKGSEHPMKNNLGILAVVLAASFLFLLVPQQVDAAGEPFSYYSQLDENEKAIFDAICGAELEEREILVDLPIKVSASGKERYNYLNKLKEDMFFNVRESVRLSDPMAYWTWGESLNTWTFTATTTVVGDTETMTAMHVSVTLNSAYEELEQKRIALVKAVNDFSTKRTDTRGIVEDINNYLVNLVTYETEEISSIKTPFAHDAYGALVAPNRAVCDGYSKAFLLLCNKYNIECLIDQGSALPSTIGHAWNYVKMDNGKWYGIDVTWNDGHNNEYFLLGSETFFSNHMRGIVLEYGINFSPFNIPAAFSKDKYDADPPTYEEYAWIFAALIVALLIVALYKSSKEK